MTVQSVIMRLLPAGVVSQPGMSKWRMLAVLRALGHTDVRGELAQITAPTLVLCGLNDRPNVPAARALASGINGAELQLVPGAGHEWNVHRPDEFSARLTAFLRIQRP